MNYPLLIRGISTNANGAGANSLTTPLAKWTNNITEGRGNVVGVDIVSTSVANDVQLASGLTGSASLFVGSSIVLQNINLADYQAESKPGNYELLSLDVAPGQTIAYDQNGTAGSATSIVHLYHENRFRTAAVIAARRTAIVKQRILQFTTDAFPTGFKNQESALFTVPSSIGNVVAMEVVAYTPFYTNLSKALFSVVIGGVRVIENASAMLCYTGCTRPLGIMPIVIRSGETFNVVLDSANVTVGSTITFGVRLYFDNDKDQNCIY
jgi:hypothetical protein